MEIRSALDPWKATEGIEKYIYDKLSSPKQDNSLLKKHLDKKRFRLLELHPGRLDNPQVVCEVFEVELDITDGTIVRVLDNLAKPEDAKATAAPTPQNGSKSKPHISIDTMAQGLNDGLQDLGTEATPTDEFGTNGASGMEPRQGERDRAMMKRLRNEEKQRSKQRQIDSVRYEALSWRWGNEDTGEHAIMIMKGGKHYPKRVSRTFGLALKYLRYRADPRILWIDALCINQDDYAERSIQVAIMDRLYTGASQVCV